MRSPGAAEYLEPTTCNFAKARTCTRTIPVVDMTNDDLAHYIIQRIIPDLEHAGFDSALEAAGDEDFVTLTIQRRHRYY